ncbi:phosphatidylinositol N-acetylglucosaminyltransferase subunit gpi1 [Saitozyma podzolica]|uniref:Phosphatidylinositol N-acetylglucosaminyltransferase subunit gpi1 n=1 Tax=Saitozyma podzolica TaxID=1890683 RepID=A0A427YUT9_9TREE|nr:phosphatidylinositol N-acetylglucosaminyltransferase subunit gpi1 [Saitozyma podzolica]
MRTPTTVFWPRTGLTRSEGAVVGWRTSDVVCVVAIVESWMEEHQKAARLVTRRDLVADLEPLGRAALCGGDEDVDKDGADYLLDSCRRIPVSCRLPVEVILYDPPDPGRLRFLTTGSALDKLQQGEAETAKGHLARQDEYGIGEKARCESRGSGDGWALEEVLPLINAAKQLQDVLSVDRSPALTGTLARVSRSALREAAILAAQSVLMVLGFAAFPIQIALRLLVIGSSAPLGVTGWTTGSLRSYSSTLDQLCLRASQMLEAPRDFTATFSSPGVPLQERSKHYMRFWNTVWLVVNDLIMGYAARRFLFEAAPMIVEAVPPLLQTHLVDDLLSALRFLNDWPVGLKLNTPLSQFYCTSLGLLISAWGEVVVTKLPSLLPTAVHILAVASLGGMTLLLALTKDALALATLHIALCDRITRAICLWQLDSLGGLWNLFREQENSCADRKKWSLTVVRREAVERSPPTNRFVRVRPRPALPRYTALHRLGISVPHGGGIRGTAGSGEWTCLVMWRQREVASAAFAALCYRPREMREANHGSGKREADELTCQARLAVVIASRSLSMMVDALNAFPLFELMLRIKEPSRLPAGVYFDLHRTRSAKSLDAGAAKHSGYIPFTLQLKVRDIAIVTNAPRSWADILFPGRPRDESSNQRSRSQ